MQAFEKAINHTDNVNIPPELVIVFKKSMELFHKHFTENNLYETFNMNKFFNENLFTNTHLKHDKLKISYHRFADNDPNDYFSISQGVRGAYFLNGNSLVMNEMLEEDFNRTLESLVLDTWENSLIYNFVHEFSHFLTMSGNMEYKQNNEIKKVSYYNQYSFLLKPHLNEMLTERFKTKIVGEQMLNYNPLVLPLKLIENVYDIDINHAFLTRSYEEFINKMGYENFTVFDEAMRDIFVQFRMNPNKINFSEELAPVINLAFKKVHQDLDNENINLTPTDFLDIRTSLYYLLPFKSFSKYGKALNQLNEKYAIFYLVKNNAPLTKESVGQVAQIINTAAKAATSLSMEQDYQLDKFLRVKLSNVTINLFVKDGMLFTYNHDMEDFYCIKDMALLINKNNEEENTYDKTYPCLQDFRVRYVKHSENDIDIYEYNENVPEYAQNEYNSNTKISLSFKNNTITLKGTEKEVSYDIYDKQNAQELDSLNDNLQNKVQELKQNTPLLLR